MRYSPLVVELEVEQLRVVLQGVGYADRLHYRLLCGGVKHSLERCAGLRVAAYPSLRAAHGYIQAFGGGPGLESLRRFGVAVFADEFLEGFLVGDLKREEGCATCVYKEHQMAAVYAVHQGVVALGAERREVEGRPGYGFLGRENGAVGRQSGERKEASGVEGHYGRS